MTRKQPKPHRCAFFSLRWPTQEKAIRAFMAQEGRAVSGVDEGALEILVLERLEPFHPALVKGKNVRHLFLTVGRTRRVYRANAGRLTLLINAWLDSRHADGDLPNFICESKEELPVSF